MAENQNFLLILKPGSNFYTQNIPVFPDLYFKSVLTEQKKPVFLQSKTVINRFFYVFANIKKKFENQRKKNYVENIFVAKWLYLLSLVIFDFLIILYKNYCY